MLSVLLLLLLAVAPLAGLPKPPHCEREFRACRFGTCPPVCKTESEPVKKG